MLRTAPGSVGLPLSRTAGKAIDTVSRRPDYVMSRQSRGFSRRIGGLRRITTVCSTRDWRGPLVSGNTPTGKPFVFKGMVLWRIQDGKIAERWAVLDQWGLRRQLGADA